MQVDRVSKKIRFLVDRGILAKSLAWLLIFILTFSFTVNLGLTQQSPLQPPQECQVKGIMAALDDPDPQIWTLALNKLSKFKIDELEIPQSKYEKIVGLLSDNQNPDLQQSVVKVLGAMGAAAKEQAPQLVKLLTTSNNEGLQYSIAMALGRMGAAAKEQAPQLVKLLATSNDRDVRYYAAGALWRMGAVAKAQAPILVKLLATSTDTSVKSDAARVLGAMGAAAKAQAPQLGKLLETSNGVDVQIYAAKALGGMGAAAKEQAPQLAKLLEISNNIDVQRYAAEALGGMGEEAKEQAPILVKFLETSNHILVQRYAAEALGRMGGGAKEQAPQLAKLLETSNNIDVQRYAAKALGGMGAAAKAQAPQLAKLLETSNNIDVQRYAAEALRNMGAAAKAQAPQLVKLLKTSNDRYLRRYAAEALGNMGAAAKAQAPQLAKLLETSNDRDVQISAAEALEKMGEANTETILSILNAVYGNQGQTSAYRFLAYFLSAAQEKSIIAIQWLGLPKEYPDFHKLEREETIKILKVFDYAWQHSQSLTRLRSDLEKQITKLIKQGKWKFQDIGLLSLHYQHLQSVNSTHSDAVKAKITQLEGWKWFFAAWRIWLAHFCFWLVLIFAYPRFSAIQAIFFWNPWVRKIIGFGYVGFLITWIPFLRSKLFIPFQRSLLADAKLEYADLQSYFDRSEVKQEASGKIKQLKVAIPEIKGQIIVQGESGLGKSLFLRHLAKNSHRIVVYLSADRCTNGVIEAIQNKLLGKAQDSDFLRNLIYSGAIDICLDGLNEVNADTRASIKKFVEQYFKGNIIMTTQPLEWKPPTTASIYILQPLQDNLIKEFLLSRQAYLAEDNQLQAQNYEQACDEYLTRLL